MIKKVKIFLQEPLVSFMILGLLLYMYYGGVTQKDVSSETKTEIKLTSYEIKSLKSEYKRRYKKDMSEEEFPLYVNNAYRKKVLLAESIGLGLHKSDAFIVKRLIEKMEFILLGSVEYKEPSEEELHEYYLKNIQEYSQVKSLSFVHLYFSQKLNNMHELYTMSHFTKLAPKDIKNLGDKFEGSQTYTDISEDKLQDIFGKYFASKLFKLKKKIWYENIHSKYGVHLVYITKKTTGEAYKFDEVEDRVYSDYLMQRKEETIANTYKDILQNYSLHLEK
ncbi:MAG: peptidylprolyl isomerase [Sulfurimonas sp.]|nr:peptidylprolyl isomerase [Sulfurimonas sp.]